MVKIGRAGWFAKGVVYVIAGVLALSGRARASGWSDPARYAGGQPDRSDQDRRRKRRRNVLLWLLALGMLIYAAWRVVSALLPGGHDTEARIHRIGYIVSAIVYTTFAITAIALARQATSDQNGNKKVTDISASVMSHTAGRLADRAGRPIVIGVGIYRLSKGVKVDVNDELDLSGMSPARVSGPNDSAPSVRSAGASASAWSASSCCVRPSPTTPTKRLASTARCAVWPSRLGPRRRVPRRHRLRRLRRVLPRHLHPPSPASSVGQCP